MLILFLNIKQDLTTDILFSYMKHIENMKYGRTIVIVVIDLIEGAWESPV